MDVDVDVDVDVGGSNLRWLAGSTITLRNDIILTPQVTQKAKIQG